MIKEARVGEGGGGGRQHPDPLRFSDATAAVPAPPLFFSSFYFSALRRKPQQEQRKEQEPKRPHIKKPLNAFMLYMKEMRANVVAECTLKESAAINQILGRRVGRQAGRPARRFWPTFFSFFLFFFFLLRCARVSRS